MRLLSAALAPTPLFQTASHRLQVPKACSAILHCTPQGSCSLQCFLPGGLHNSTHIRCSSLPTVQLSFTATYSLPNPLARAVFPLRTRAPKAVPILTSQPRHVVGFGRWSVNFEGFGRKHFPVFRFFYQVPDFSHQPVQEPRQHGSATHNHQVLCQLLPGVYGTLTRKGIEKKKSTSMPVAHRCFQRPLRNAGSCSMHFNYLFQPRRRKHLHHFLPRFHQKTRRRNCPVEADMRTL